MALLNPSTSQLVAYHERNYESDSGFSADDYSSVDPIAVASEITSVASRASKNKSVLKLNTRDDGTVITLDETPVIVDSVHDHGIEDDAGDGVESDVERRNPLVVSFKEDDHIQDSKSGKNKGQKQSIHFVTKRIKASWLDNTYQKAIARARARLAKGNWPEYPEEWRLPHAPLPARPDYTRTGPVASLTGGYLEAKRNRKERRKRSETFPRAKSDTKNTERQTILPPIDALYNSLFANLSASYPSHLLRKRWESSAAAASSSMGATSVSSDLNSTSYLPFIGTARLHPKELTPTVRRDDSSQPPSFCYGCTAELGNLPDSKAPLFFLDNPDNSTDDDRLGIEHAQLVPQNGPAHQHVATTRVCYGCSLSKLPHVHVTKPRRVGGGYTMVRQAVEPYRGDIPKDGGSPPPSTYISDDMSSDDEDIESHYDAEIDEEERGILDYINVAKLDEPTLPLPSIPREKPLPIPLCILEKIKAKDVKAVSLHERHCYACREALKHYWPEYFTLRDESDGSTSGVGTSIGSEALEEEERRQEERRRQLEEARQLRLEEDARRKEEEAERRKNLYKPPKAFQLKKTEKKEIESKDPFSTDRNLNIPKNEGFKLKKTEKQTTKFIEHSRQETEWKEPKKFELTKTEPKTTKTDWKPPERPERLRPATPPTPPPPPKGKKPTVPIEPKKREPPPKKPDPPKQVEKPKPIEKPKPVEKPKEPPQQKSKKQEPPTKPVAAGELFIESAYYILFGQNSISHLKLVYIMFLKKMAFDIVFHFIHPNYHRTCT
ncbi:uncharacterized protein LOC121420922 isoform X3 [Lytechinus variegatus]|uniref:uncharacterized protein LOC121420922 isoform X3 n=1 Tax=Lytechinus variegatus TaxID=7654 RepID=UPI001BB238F6|nr:uncharacterized protein LOC121420922 isoform X3 [Lytechinus variegatus]